MQEHIQRLQQWWRCVNSTDSECPDSVGYSYYVYAYNDCNVDERTYELTHVETGDVVWSTTMLLNTHSMRDLFAPGTRACITRFLRTRQLWLAYVQRWVTFT